MDAPLFSACTHPKPSIAPISGRARRAAQTLRQRFFSVARSAKSEPGNGKPFAIRDGLFEVLDAKELSDRAVLFTLFIEAARAGIALSRRTERSIAYIMMHPELPAKNVSVTWAMLREILVADYPGVRSGHYSVSDC